MESLLFLIPLIACPLSMAAIGAIGWLWAKASGRSQRTEPDATTTPEPSRASAEVAVEGA
jgi:hypothetical protein